MSDNPLCFDVIGKNIKIENYGNCEFECCVNCTDYRYGDCCVPEAYVFAYNKAIDDVIQKVKSIGLSGISSSQGNLIYVLESMKGEKNDNQ